ncbi:MAG: DUF4837 family protein [Bacteroidales bacterium]|nr:DUF4837 family protein [Bacteroidales bacterium]
MKNMQMIFGKLAMAGFVILALAGCDFDSSALQPSTGKTNEMVVVTPGEAYWNGKMGQLIKQYFGQEVPGLPQSEEMFDIAHIPEDNFAKLFKTHHNIFIVEINPDYKKPFLETKADLWAKPQRVVKMVVPAEKDFYDAFAKNKEAFAELFNENERHRANTAFATIQDFDITGMLRDKYQVTMVVPKSFYVATKADDFVWMRREAELFSQAIMIWHQPYSDTSAFDYNRLLAVRDSITRKYIPGPSDGTYMKIAMQEPPLARRIDFKGHFAVEMRGLWDVEGDFMGGPFLSYTFVDEPNSRLVTIDGYAYNPSHEKRNLVRQLEAMLYTYQFNSDRNNEQKAE